ncbi:tetratricopeptide repeat protein [Pinibacter soli]|uniref:Tetratricopeptide repeat protein n=1 Tax=Pinibacter soli TaxID=3044211 RepID=A0ABT6RD00_9BACT|nr:tetratricopeptide repeat protein [Pinibacter soli]MDI3320356.1 tetratricopeptide repeat protein [Pinibacter soli]
MKLKNTIRFKITFLFLIFITQSVFAQPKHKKTDDQLITDYLHKGYDYQVNKQPDLAVIEYDKVLKLDSTNPTAYYNTALIYANSKQTLKAIAICDKALQLCTEDLADFYRTKANCYSDLHQFEESLPLFHKALLLEGSEADDNTYYNLGYSYFKLQKWESAIVYLNKYLERGDEKSGSVSDALFFLATCYSESGDDNKAIQYFDQAIAKSPHYSYYYNKAETLMNLNKKDEALKVINQALVNYPDKADLYFKKSQIYTSLKQTEKAKTELKHGYEIDSTNTNILLDMGVIYKHDNQIDMAITMYKKCIELKDNLSGAYGNLALIYGDIELKRDSALYYFQKALSVDNKNPINYYNMGNYYREEKKYDLALEMYAKAIELKPLLSAAYTNTAIIYEDKKDLKKAIDFALKALDIEPDDYYANSYLASLYFDSTDYENTILYTTKALRLSANPNIDHLLLYKRGVSRQIVGDYKNALHDYLDIVKRYSEEEKKEHADVYSNIGYCYMEDDQLQASLKYFQEAVNYKPEIDQLIGLFTVQYLLNDKAGSDKTVSKAKKVEPKLKQGYKGIEQLEKDGYFYTKKHKDILQKILN